MVDRWHGLGVLGMGALSVERLAFMGCKGPPSCSPVLWSFFPVLSAMNRDTKASMNQLLTSDCVVSVAGR